MFYKHSDGGIILLVGLCGWHCYVTRSDCTSILDLKSFLQALFQMEDL